MLIGVTSFSFSIIILFSMILIKKINTELCSQASFLHLLVSSHALLSIVKFFINFNVLAKSLWVLLKENFVPVIRPEFNAKCCLILESDFLSFKELKKLQRIEKTAEPRKKFEKNLIWLTCFQYKPKYTLKIQSQPYLWNSIMFFTSEYQLIYIYSTRTLLLFKKYTHCFLFHYFILSWSWINDFIEMKKSNDCFRISKVFQICLVFVVDSAVLENQKPHRFTETQSEQ